MNTVSLPMDRLQEAPWNPNRMDEPMTAKLGKSIARYGFVQSLVVRPLADDSYEVLSGNQRLRVLREMEVTEAPCVVVDADDAQARLLAQALNRVQGDDDLGLKAELVRFVLERVPQTEVLSLLPESAESLTALSSLGEIDIAEHLQAWQKAQSARLKHLTFQLAPSQLDLIEEALDWVSAGTLANERNPNRRGNALYAICKAHLERLEGETP